MALASGQWTRGVAQEATPVLVQQALNVSCRDGNALATQLDVHWIESDQPNPALIAGLTLGQIADQLRSVFGEYRPGS